KKNKKGLPGKFKVVGQIVLGVVVGFTLYFHPDITVKLDDNVQVKTHTVELTQEQIDNKETKALVTTIPFTKNNEFDYSKLISWLGENALNYSWILFIPIVIFIITAVSNGANLTDGIDGLAAGSSAIIVSTLGIFAWVSGNIIFSDYLNIMYIPQTGEMTIFITAFVGGLIGFLWYNTYPAQVFMGDTGSLDRKSTRLNSSHVKISYAVFCLKKKTTQI